MPLIRSGYYRGIGRWKRLGRLSSAQAPANQAIGAGVFINLESVGCAVVPLLQNQALLIRRYTCSLVEPGNGNLLFLAQPPLITVQVNPFGLTNSILSFSSNVQGGVGVAGNPNYGALSSIGTNFVLEDVWLEFDDYLNSLSTYTTLTSKLVTQALRLNTDVRVWNSSGAGQNLRFAESLLYEIWQLPFNEASPT